MAYFELNIDDIIETYCVNKEKPQLQCNGKCHLTKQLTLDASEKNESASYLSGLYQAFFPVFFKTNETKNLLVFVEEFFENNWHYSNRMYVFHKDHLDPPPQYLM